MEHEPQEWRGSPDREWLRQSLLAGSVGRNIKSAASRREAVRQLSAQSQRITRWDDDAQHWAISWFEVANVFRELLEQRVLPLTDAHVYLAVRLLMEGVHCEIARLGGIPAEDRPAPKAAATPIASLNAWLRADLRGTIPRSGVKGGSAKLAAKTRRALAARAKRRRKQHGA